MKQILIISIYPNEFNIKDGMIRRVNEIEQKFKEDYKRIYLNISIRNNKKKEVVLKENLEVYNINLFKHYFIILNQIKNNQIIYIHSLYNYLKIFLIPKLKQKNIILDLHGVIPEENEYENKIILSKLFNFLEKKLFKNLDKAIFVTEKMRKFYKEKYPKEMKNIKSIVLPIIESKKENNFKKNISNLKIENKVVIIYSGNTQKWQNIDLMLECINNNLSNERLYIILTGEKEKLIKKFKEKNISEKYYLIDSVLPQELYKYYEIANYGFILRDDQILNKVANPTKLGEYLDYGIIPIVKLEEIGDYKELGYEYITIDKFNDSLPKIKSQKNIEIMKKYREKSEKLDFLKFIED